MVILVARAIFFFFYVQTIASYKVATHLVLYKINILLTILIFLIINL